MGPNLTQAGACVRDRVQDFYDCRAGDFVWGVYQLGAGAFVLGWETDWDFLEEKGQMTGMKCRWV